MLRSDASLNEWLHYFETRPQQTIQLGLERIKTVAERLQLLPVMVPVITVAGTNGKGSTVSALEAIYTEAGYRVGAYTSPHLLYFNERIRLNQQPASDEAICQAFTLIESVRESIHLTYFEMATLAALLYYKRMQAEVIILEVGLGGRLDATNIVDANVAVITTIDFDHEDYLGHTLEMIGFEKAGILKSHRHCSHRYTLPDVGKESAVTLNQTLVYADSSMPVSVRQRARDLQVKTICLNEDYEYDLSQTKLTIFNALQHGFLERSSVVLSRPNLHPKAAAAAVVVVQCLHDQLPVDALSLQHAMEKVKIAGRQQIIHDTICTVLDVSHNPQSVKLLAERMEELIKEKSNGRVYAVFSGLKDKDLCGLIQPMHPWVDKWYSAVLDNPRAATESMIRDAFAQTNGLTPSIYGSIVEAYQAARDCAEPGDILVVYGSFYVVSPIILETAVET